MVRKAVIFDLFGTLVDNWPLEERRLLLAAMATELGAAEAQLNQVWDEHRGRRDTGAFQTVPDAVRAACGSLSLGADEAAIQRASGLYSRFAERCLQAREDAVETVRALREQGFRIGLISDCGPPTPLIWHHTALGPLFDVTTFSCEVGLKKPDPRIYHLTCKSLDVAPSSCLYVGDGGSRELSGAEAVGMRALMIRTPQEDVIAPLRVDADSWTGPRIRALSEVLSHVE